MTSFEEIQDKGLLAAKGLQSLLMEGIGAAQGVGQAVGQGIGRTTQAVGQTTQAVGSGLSSLLEKPIEGFKGLDPYTRAEIGGLVGQVIGEALTGREAPKMAETIRQVPAVLRERKEKQEEKQIEKLKLLRKTQADERKEERAERKDAREERKEEREQKKLQSEFIKQGQVELDQNNIGLVEQLLDKPYRNKYITVSKDKNIAPIFNQKKYEDDLASAKKDIEKTELQFEKYDNILSAIDDLMFVNENGELQLTELGNAITATDTTEALIEAGSRFLGNPNQKTAMTKLKLIQANLGFDELQKMRDASPTGGALGSVSDKEVDFLINAQKALAEGMTPKDFTRELNRLRTGLLKFKEQGILSVDDILSRSVKGATKKEKSRLVYNPNTGEFE